MLAHGVAALRDQLGRPPQVGALAHARGRALELPFPRAGVAQIGGEPQPLDDRQLPLHLVRILRHEGALAGLVGAGQRRLLDVAAVARDPAERGRELAFDLLAELGPGLLGLDLSQQGIEIGQLAARLLAGVEVAAPRGRDVARDVVEPRHGARQPRGGLTGTVMEGGA